MAVIDRQDTSVQVIDEISWILAKHPGVKEGTDEWKQASQEYWELYEVFRYLSDVASFKASLNNIEDCYEHAIKELDELELLQIAQPNIVQRMAFVHCVTVLEAFLMYAARALLNHSTHLKRFHANKSKFLQNKRVKELDEAHRLENEYQDPIYYKYHVVPGQEDLKITEVTFESREYYKERAQETVSTLTFHNLARIKNYFDSVLSIPPDWPLDDMLQSLIDTRQDLVHRNGVSKDHQKIAIDSERVGICIKTVRHFIVIANEDFQAEIARYSSVIPPV